MKRLISTIILILLLQCFLSCASRLKSQNVEIDQLGGFWLLENSSEEGLLEYEKFSANSDYSGSSLQIFENGEITDSHILMGNNCKTLFSSNGTWRLNKNKLILKSSVPIDLQSEKFKIIKLDSTKLVLSAIKTN